MPCTWHSVVVAAAMVVVVAAAAAAAAVQLTQAVGPLDVPPVGTKQAK